MNDVKVTYDGLLFRVWAKCDKCDGVPSRSSRTWWERWFGSDMCPYCHDTGSIQTFITLRTLVKVLKGADDAE